ncbi:MAG: glycosyltransferase family 39 protein [Saprospiraceae bacterium]|nr:glycosyltransferase family 39 protein [Saprospiraceae bacterium]MBK6782362.1 glycosyltransferase family 39 protein [Saprospiraceae bacterium]MBK7524120.1 glycosyltransferase family 39 protein [Saprospiraceae bacterium]MBK8372172.1 glycosyltransferase family 39 protein [Saprospiraceae bacterium]MBK8547439.1 glycosyltransferase family 39 protein [Saprospiraceae bacterium]
MLSDKIKSVTLTTIIFLVLSFVYEMPHWLIQKPCSVHVWRQSDCASYALNYFQNERGFFSPQVHHRHAIDGATCSEFPIIYYTASKLYKWFGFNDYYIRWINYLILYAALIAVTLTSVIVINNLILATFPAVLLMMSCIIMYYGSNFLPDVPALSCALIGFYFFVKHSKSTRDSDIYIAIFFSVLAALLKISSAILFIVIALFVIYQRLIKKNLLYSRAHIFIIFSGFLTVFMWLIFVKVYNEMGQYFGNLQGTMGIWLTDKNTILYIIQRTFTEWMPAMVSYKIWWFLVPVILYVIFHWKKLNEIFTFFLPFVALACICYLLAFFAVFNVHDYYFINVFCFPVLLSIAFFHIIEQQLSVKQLRIFFALSFILFIMCAEDTRAQFLFRRYDQGWNSVPPQGFYGIEQYLRSLGIDRNTLIYSPSDPTTNVSLYLSNNPGWTNLFGTTVADAKSRGAQYMLIESSLLEQDSFKEYKEYIIGEHKGILIVKL